MYFYSKNYKNNKLKIYFIINIKILIKIHKNNKNINFVLFFPQKCIKIPPKVY